MPAQIISADERPWHQRLVTRAKRLARRARRRRVDLFFDEAYELALPGAPLDPQRGRRILSFLEQEGLTSADWVHPGGGAVSFVCLRGVHDDAYLASLAQPGAFTSIVGFSLAPAVEQQLLRTQRHWVGGTIKAAQTARTTGRVAVNLGGGLHHARRDRGGGFCALNDVAAAVWELRRTGYRRPILIVDLDLHDGDGTRTIFADDPEVHTFSLHNADWDRGPAVASTQVALGDDVDDDVFLAALREHLPPVVEHFRPGLVFYVAGVDGAADDALGNWRLTADGLLRRDRYVCQLVRAGLAPLPLVITLAGGYGGEAWRYTARFLGWVASRGQVIEPPSTDAQQLQRYLQVAARIDPTALTLGEDEGFVLTERELLESLSPHLGETLLLGYYTEQGVELALEQYGILPRLRQLGYPAPQVEFDLGDAVGHRIRVYGDAARRELLIDTIVRRDRETVPSMELLAVEWLLLQNPRAEFTAAQPPIPGQSRPGLGMLREIAGLFVIICRRLGLDGIVFVPAHYALAAVARSELQFLRREDAAHFRRVRAAVAGLPLALATRALEAGEVRDDASGESLAWRPMPMVRPVSERLARRLAREQEGQHQDRPEADADDGND